MYNNNAVSGGCLLLPLLLIASSRFGCGKHDGVINALVEAQIRFCGEDLFQSRHANKLITDKLPLAYWGFATFSSCRA